MNDFTLISTSYNKNHKFTFRVKFTEKQDITNNKTNLSFKLQMEYTSGPGTAWAEYGSKLRYTLKINGESFSGNIPDYYEGDYENTKKTLVILSNKSLSNAIAHNTNGTKSISVSMEIIDNTPVEYVPSNASKTQTLSLTPIPRTSSFTISSTSINVEDSVKFIITRNATSFTHKISWSVVYNNTTTQIKTHNLGTTINTNLTVPLEFYDFFIKNKIKEISTTITCTTYSGTTKIGAATKTATVKMSAVKCTPIITNIILDETSVNILGTFNQNSVIEKKEGQAPNVTISYNFPSANYLARIKAVVSSFSTEVIKEVSSFEEKIKIVDPTGFFSSAEKTLKDFNNYEFYNKPQGEITNVVKNYTVQTESETVNGETITSTVYKITEFNCDILLSNYLPYLMTDEQVNKIYYRYGIYKSTQDLGFSDIYEAEINNNVFSVLKNSNLEEEDIAITLDKLTTPFNVIIKLWDDKSTENQAIEIKKTIIIQPLFDWSEEDFRFNIPVQLPFSSLTAAAANNYYNFTTKTGGAINLRNSDIIGIDKLIFSDPCQGFGEGIIFPQNNSGTPPNKNHTGAHNGKYDILKGYNGKLYYYYVYTPGDDTDDTMADKFSEVPLCYKKGDTIQFNGQVEFWTGVVTSDSKQLMFTIPLDKPIDSKVTNITITNGNFLCRLSQGGYLMFNGGTDNNISYTSSKISNKNITMPNKKSIRVSITVSQKFLCYKDKKDDTIVSEALVNNQVIAIASNASGLTFTFS